LINGTDRMASKHKVKLGEVDVTKLQTDAAIRNEAKRMLPKAMKDMAKAIAEDAWNSIGKALGGSSSDKSKFFRDATQELLNDSAQKRDMEKILIAELTKEKKRRSS
jgi:hypothetical protein